jgi:hypothetical protein
MSFQGFGRSSVAAELGQDISADTQAQIADIERQSAGAINQFKATALDKFNNRISELQQKVDKYGDARDEAELGKIQAQGQLMIDLFKQSPSNPENMIKVAEELKKERFEQKKLELEEIKEVRQATKDNFEYMVNNFGSDYINNMSDEDLSNMAYNMGVPASTLANLGKTQKEQDREWEEMKWIQDKEYDAYKEQSRQQFENLMFDKKAQQDLNNLGIKYEMDKGLLKFKSDADADKFRNLGYGDYAEVADGIVGNGSGLLLNDGSQVSPGLKNANVPGAKKAPGSNGLGGQCAYEAGNMVYKPGTKERMNYGMDLEAKKANLATYVKNGKAFYGNKGQAQVGNSLITNESKKWGHVAVINEILPDGSYVLSEYNRQGKLAFSNNRVVKPDAGFILGVIKTTPQAKYQVAKEIQNLATDVAKKDPLVKTGMTLFGMTTIGKALGAIPKDFDAEGNKQALKRDFVSGDAQLQEELNNRANIEEQIDLGQRDENGNQLSEFRQLLRSGNVPQTQITKMLNSDYIPQEFYSDIQYAETNKPKDANKDFTQMNQLYGRVEPVIKNIRTLNDGFSYADAYENLPEKDNYTDQALINSFMKVLDPGSTVREGEFNTAMANQGLLNSLGVKVDNLQGKAMLSDSARNSILRLMKEKYKTQKQSYTNELSAQNKIFENLGFNPSDIYPQEFIGGFQQPVTSVASRNNDPLNLGF